MLQAVVRMLVIHSYMAISIIFLWQCFCNLYDLILDYYKMKVITIIALVDICFSILIGGEASCQKAIEGAEVFGEDILNFFLVL